MGFSLTPSARVVSLERKSQPAVGRQHSSIPASRVVVVEIVDVALAPSLLAGSQDVEVMAVQIYQAPLAYESNFPTESTRNLRIG